MKNDSNEAKHPLMESRRIERELEETRERIEERAQELQARLTPHGIAEQVMDHARGSRGREFFSGLGRTVTENPVPTTLTGVALAWLAAASRRSSRTCDVPEHHQYGAGAGEAPAAGAADSVRHAAERVRSAGHDLADRGRELGRRVQSGSRRARDTWNHALDEQPFLLGLLGIAAGAALGATLPHTDAEDEWVGPASDRVKRRAVARGREKIEDLHARAESEPDDDAF